MIKKLGLRSQVRETKDSHFASQDKLFNHINWETNFEGIKKGPSLSMSYILKHLQLLTYFFLKYMQIAFCVWWRGRVKKLFSCVFRHRIPYFYLKMIRVYFPRINTRNANRIYFSMHFKKRNLTETTVIVVKRQLWKLLTVWIEITQIVFIKAHSKIF